MLFVHLPSQSSAEVTTSVTVESAQQPAILGAALAAAAGAFMPLPSHRAVIADSDRPLAAGAAGPQLVLRI